MEKYSNGRKERLKKSQQLQSVSQHARYLGIPRATSGLGKSILDWAKPMLSIFPSNKKLPEIPTPDEELKLKQFTQIQERSHLPKKLRNILKFSEARRRKLVILRGATSSNGLSKTSSLPTPKNTASPPFHQFI
ncbi:hypothetical protein O181_070564 [Austropuccinia psidii MF-1]|uniref:Uncharacterized protein n=1 Tax=Austropuccinia psidii MF-1 TaxID=1389203 RepID=A0A9Q3F127_9BASI|nr:hypothetical protein [Austropuccinia psidii MF-1]